MRREIVGRGVRYRRSAAIAALLFLSQLWQTAAQEVPESIIEIAEQMAEECPESSVEELLEIIGEMARNPLDLNRASREEMEKCLILSKFQIESIIAYRKESGSIGSFTELSFVDGFTEELVRKLSLLLKVGNNRESTARKLRYELRSRYKQKFEEDGASCYGRFGMEYGSFSAGFTLESDAGEKLRPDYLPDFASFFARFSTQNRTERALIANVVIGDYSARFGQGLVLWKAFPMTVTGMPASIMKKDYGITPYRSSDENNFFRGAALSVNLGRKSCISLFASANGVDARITDDGYTSIVTDGLHRTETELAKRDAMREYVAGGNYSVTGEYFKCGFTAAFYFYDQLNARKISDYNRYQMYDGIWGNVGIDAAFSINHFRVFAEIASDIEAAFAAIAGVIWSPSYSFESSLQIRHYPKDYIATHAGASSSLSTCSNQEGVSAAVRYIMGKWDCSANCDCSYYPWARFRVPESSSMIKAVLRGDRTGEKTQLKLQGAYSYKSHGNVNRYNLRSAFKIEAGHGMTFETRVDAVCIISDDNSSGFSVLQDFSYGTPNGKYSFSARFMRFWVDKYDSRIYVYEKDLPLSFPVYCYYGNGYSAYMLVRLRLFNTLRLDIKYARVHYFNDTRVVSNQLKFSFVMNY